MKREPVEVADLEQVARLLIANGHTAEVQAGGGITVDGRFHMITTGLRRLGSVRLAIYLHVPDGQPPVLATEAQQQIKAAKQGAFARRMAARIEGNNLYGCVQEHQFHDTRKWRFDFAWPQWKVAVECEGITWQADGSTGAGRHTSGSGFEGDCEKYNAAALAGWLVLRYTQKLASGTQAVEQIRQALMGRGWIPADAEPDPVPVRRVKYPVR